MRTPQAALLSVALVSVGVLGVLMLAAFVTPERPITRQVVDFGTVEDFAPSTVPTFRLFEDSRGPIRLAHDAPFLQSCTPYYDGVVVHLSRLEDGSFKALDGRSTHLDELVVWQQDHSFPGSEHLPSIGGGWFVEPCHAETFAIDGTWVYGPAPRGLDSYDVRIEDGRVVVDLRDLHKGYRPPPIDWGPSGPPTATATLRATEVAQP